MGKLNFCPYDFKEIDTSKPENLAYEIIPEAGYTWEKISSIRLIKNAGFAMEENKRLGDRFKDQSKYVIAKEGGRSVAGSFQKFLADIDAANGSKKKNIKNPVEDDDEMNMSSAEDDLKLPGERNQKFPEEDFSIIQLGYDLQENGTYAFNRKDGLKDTIMFAVPCCPHCHHQLPQYWTEAEDFCGISLLADTYGGKTTLLLSMLNNNWSCMKGLGEYPKGSGKRLRITSANDEDSMDEDRPYNRMKKAAEGMCKKHGECPDNTATNVWIEPVFLSASYNGHRMIAGIYDNAGEVLMKAQMTNVNIERLRDKMYGYIYLIDPKNMNIKLSPKTSNHKDQKKVRGLDVLMTLEEQAAFQRENSNMRITGNELLKQEQQDEADHNGRRKTPVFKLYDKFFSRVLDQKGDEYFYDKYFCGTIVKSDLLEDSPSVSKEDGYYTTIFDRSRARDYLDDGMSGIRSDAVKYFIEENHMFDDELATMDDIEDTFDGRVSWHCISALGCAAEELEEGDRKWGRLLDDYRPIRVAEPLVRCIVSKIKKNGWKDTPA